MKLKSITAKQLFHRHPKFKAKLWEGNFWTSGYCANTVGQYGKGEVIRKYIETKERENLQESIQWSAYSFLILRGSAPGVVHLLNGSQTYK